MLIDTGVFQGPRTQSLSCEKSKIIPTPVPNFCPLLNATIVSALKSLLANYVAIILRCIGVLAENGGILNLITGVGGHFGMLLTHELVLYEVKTVTFTGNDLIESIFI